MKEYILKRVILFIPTIIIVAALLFGLTRILPGDAIDSLLNEDEASSFFSPEIRAQVEAELGLDDPLPIQFAKWVWGAAHFDYGTSFWRKQPNIDIVKTRFFRTVEVALLAAAVAIVWGITSGVLQAVYQNTWIDAVLRFVTVGGIAIPNFMVAVMIFYFLILFFDWIPPIEYKSLLEDPWSNIKQHIAPILVLGHTAGAPISRLTRSQFLEVYREDYIRTARAKGLKEKVVVLRHTLRNCMLPVITIAGLLVGDLLGGVVIVETVFAIPGMGQMTILAVNSRDYPLLQTLVWMITFMYMMSNLLVDVAYAWIDPRIRYK